MPADTLAGFGNWSELGQAALVARLTAVASELRVTAPALKWRLVALGALTPALFTRPFMEVLGLAVGEGLVSMRRAATLLELSVDELSDLFAVHGVAQPAEP